VKNNGANCLTAKTAAFWGQPEVARRGKIVCLILKMDRSIIGIENRFMHSF